MTTAIATRRELLALAAAFALLPPARAQGSYPTRPLQLTHGFGAGGNADIVSRLLAQKMQDGLGQPMVVEIKSGAGGLIATDFVAKARPDGYNLAMLTGAHTVSAALRRKLPYDPVNDFAFVSTVTSFPFVIAVRAEHKARDLAELLASARQAPGQVSFTSVGVGSTQHMVGELLGVSAGAKLLHVPYRGGGAPVQAVIGGDVDILADTLTVATPHIQSGRLRALAVSGAQRAPMLPNVPTMAEAGLPNFDASVWWTLLAPAGTAPEVVAKLNAETRKALADAGTREKLGALGAVITPSSPQEAAAFLKSESAKWEQVIRAADIKAD